MVDFFRNHIWRLGHFWSVALITVVSVLLSVSITCFTFYFVNTPITDTTLLAAVIAPLIIAPLVTTFLVRVVIEIHFIEEKMRELATYDDLTGLMTRRHFLELAATYEQLARRNRYIYTILIMDLDHFKGINDSYGHQAGDEALREVGRTFQASMRSSDLIGRYGGEEFICLLPNTGASQAASFCKSLHETIRKIDIRYDGHHLPLTISIGVTTYEHATNNVDLQGLIRQADQALYHAKNRRDSTILYRELQSPTCARVLTAS